MAIIEVLPEKKLVFAVVAAKIRFGNLICFFDNCIFIILQPPFFLLESFLAIDLDYKINTLDVKSNPSRLLDGTSKDV